MFDTILVPIDLSRADTLGKAIDAAVGMARHSGATLHMLGVTTYGPTSIANTEEEYETKLRAFAEEQGTAHGVTFTPHAVPSTDPSVDIDKTLMEKCKELGVDLVVMASHIPNFSDRIFSSRAGYLATHASISVFVVR